MSDTGYTFERFQADIRSVRASSVLTAEGVSAAIWREFESLRGCPAEATSLERVAKEARTTVAALSRGDDWRNGLLAEEQDALNALWDAIESYDKRVTP